MVKSGTVCVLDEKGVIALGQFHAVELFGISEVLTKGQWANITIANDITALARFLRFASFPLT